MIILVRHAESVANAGKPTTDPVTIGLTDMGVQQAEALARRWESVPRRIVCSPFARAIGTAQPLAARFGLTIEIAPVHEFTYLAPARCSGTTVDQRRAWVDAYWKKALPDYRDGIGAETFREFAFRVQAALSAVALDSWGDVVVVCHGQVMQMARWFDEHPDTNIDSNAMHEFRRLDLEGPINHCQMIKLGSMPECPAEIP